jgi:hypothetical protein
MCSIRGQVQDLRRVSPRARRAIWGIALASGLTVGAAHGALAQATGSVSGGAASGAQNPVGAAVRGAAGGEVAKQRAGSPETIAAMKGDLRRLVSANEVYHAKNGRYSASVATLLAYHATAGVTVTILSATAGGWAAQATAAVMPGKSCVIFVGSVPTAPTTQAEKRSAAEAVVVCDQG